MTIPIKSAITCSKLGVQSKQVLKVGGYVSILVDRLSTWPPWNWQIIVSVDEFMKAGPKQMYTQNTKKLWRSTPKLGRSWPPPPTPQWLRPWYLCNLTQVTKGMMGPKSISEKHRVGFYSQYSIPVPRKYAVVDYDTIRDNKPLAESGTGTAANTVYPR